LVSTRRCTAWSGVENPDGGLWLGARKDAAEFAHPRIHLGLRGDESARAFAVGCARKFVPKPWTPRVSRARRRAARLRAIEKEVIVKQRPSRLFRKVTAQAIRERDAVQRLGGVKIIAS